MTRFKWAICAAIGFAAASVLLPPPASAAIEYPWCVLYAGGPSGGGKNCGFISYDQCMMTARGAGGMCIQNLFYPGIAEPSHAARKRHSRN